MINTAMKEAIKSSCRCKHGAIITKGGSVIARGYNSYRPHPIWGTGPLSTLHAEAAAIRYAVAMGCSTSGATMYIARHGENSNMSRPCSGCMARIRKAGIRKIVYTNVEGEIITEAIWKQ
jgi:deoxycytidylate deaminase